MTQPIQLTPEELLLPRYKVIAPWPGMHMDSFHLEQIVILQPHTDDTGDCFIHIHHKHTPGDYMRQGFFEQYPHLFKKLEWWEDRAPEEMPEYVKSIRQEYDYGIMVGHIVKVKEWVLLSAVPYVIQSPKREYHPACLAPATQEEYEAYQKTKQ